jgi:transcriptional regulator with GAF, ATPase, and Fis domain
VSEPQRQARAHAFREDVLATTFTRYGSIDQDSRERRFEQLIGNSPALEAVLEQVERVAPTNSTVLIQGESGTGKELIARAIHNISSRCGRRFVKLNSWKGHFWRF